MTYIATISHHSIASAREIQITGTLTAAKRRASREFGDGFFDHRISIYEAPEGRAPELVATRLVGERRWADRR